MPRAVVHFADSDVPYQEHRTFYYDTHTGKKYYKEDKPVYPSDPASPVVLPHQPARSHRNSAADSSQLYVPVLQVPVPVPQPVFVPQPVVPVVPPYYPCYAYGCPGPHAHHHSSYHHHQHAMSSSEKERPSKLQKDPQPQREKLSPLLQTRPYSRSKSLNGPLIDVETSPMTYIYERYDRKALDSLATTPPLDKMIIVHGSLPWTIQVRAKDARGITVRDVLDTVWQQLNIPVSESEANKTRGAFLVMRYYDRVSDARTLLGDRYAGLKRMYWMKLDSYRLIGLEPYKTDKWMLVFEKCGESETG